MIAGRPNHAWNPCRAGRRAFTRVELLVMVAALAVVLGLALGLMVESDHAAAKITRHEVAVQYCQAALDEVTRALRGAVPPAGVKMNDAATSAFRFGRDELALLVIDKNTTGGLSLVTFANARDNGPLPAGIVRGRGAFPAAGPAHFESLGGARPERVKPSIRFGYAAAARPGVKVDYRDVWTSAALPALVQVTVAARLDGSVRALPDIELQTAVIPGGLPPLRPAAKSNLPVEAALDFTLAPPPAAPESAPAALDDAAPPAGSVKVIKAEPARVVLKPEKLDEVKEAPAR